MESRLIYIANEKIKSKVAWFKPTDTEWIYFGATTEINKSIVQQRIDSHFSETILYIAHTRLGSFETEKNIILDKIKNILGYENFVVWNISFSKAIEFNKIGVLRYGEVGSE